MSHAVPIKTSSYVYGLDAARFLCALMVSIFHLTWRNPETALYAPVGWVGVQVFFVISGVVIANSAANSSVTQFIRGRFLRLYPAAWIAGMINLGFLLALPFSSYQAMGISVSRSVETMLSSFVLLGSNFMASAYWTLPIELAFYGLICASLWAGGLTRFRLLARALILVSAPYLLLLALSQSTHPALAWIDLGYGPKNMLLLRHGGFFAIGMYFWLINSGQRLARLDYAILAIGFGAAALEIYSRAAQVLHMYAVPSGGIVAPTLAVAAFSAFGAFSLLIFTSLRKASSWVPNEKYKGWLRTLGLVTYPYYLVHELAGGFFLNAAMGAGINRPLSITIALGAVGLIAYFIARFGEPLLRQVLIGAYSWATKMAREYNETLPRA